MPAHEPMVSYSQNFEDVVLARVLADIPQGFYVDVGANHPERDSITCYFSRKGWHGINVEPGRDYAELMKARPHDVNLNVAVSDVPGPVTFYEGASAGLSGLCEEVPENLKWSVGERTTRNVQAVTLSSILDEHAKGTIDFLSVDVEGHEKAVLSSNDWARHRPRVVVVEATLPGTSTPCHEEWEPILLAAGYQFAYFDFLNRFYVRNEDSHRLKHFGPPSIFDRFITSETAKLRSGSPAIAEAVKEITAERDILARQVAALNRDMANLTQSIGPRSLKLSLWMGRKLSALKRRVA